MALSSCLGVAVGVTGQWRLTGSCGGRDKSGGRAGSLCTASGPAGVCRRPGEAVREGEGLGERQEGRDGRCGSPACRAAASSPPQTPYARPFVHLAPSGSNSAPGPARHWPSPFPQSVPGEVTFQVHGRCLDNVQLKQSLAHAIVPKPPSTARPPWFSELLDREGPSAPPCGGPSACRRAKM